MSFTRNVSAIILILIMITGWFMFSKMPFLTKRSHLTQNIKFSDESHFEVDSISPKSEFILKERFESSEHMINQLPPSPSHRITQNPGDWRLFSVLNVATEEYEEINATLKISGSHSLIYSTYTSGSYDSIYQGINNSFESTIYPKLTEFFGSPTDIDSNGKIIILLFNIIDDFGGGQFVAGFFDPLHQYPNTIYPDSEQAEILHIDGGPEGAQEEGYNDLKNGNFAVIAHEFQHLIHYKTDKDETIWLEEGASMFSEYLIGRDPFSTGSYKSSFTSRPYVSLTYWDYFDSQSLVLANYGAAYAFFLYLAEKYGGSSIIQDIVNRSTNGISSVEEALVNQDYLGDFKEVFRNWTIANFLDNTSIGSGAYGYYNTNISISIEHTYISSPLNRTENSVPYWGTDYLEFDYPSEIPFYLEFGGTSSSGFLVTAILTNTTTPPLDIEVVSIPVSTSGFGNFSTEDLGISADNIVIVVSSYTKFGTDDHDDRNPAPSQSYWYMVNPKGLIVSPGNLSLITNDELLLDLWNIVVTDSDGLVWDEADGAIYDILTDSGESSGITGNLVYNTANNYWEATSIDISSLSEGDYYVKFYFFNSSSSGFAYTDTFSISEEMNSSTTEPTKGGLPISGFLVILSILTLTILLSKVKKEE
ncbi:MAG: hypothetical protein ACFE8U_11650 [Candidatus Hermodarchaeota archaeon]